ncbi:MAG: hypothetical protein HUU21_00165 [Polyangiaceae bacterium]|nr:hypothetical protein [Polyangiaceae bacterium]
MRRHFAALLTGLFTLPLAGCGDDTREGPALTVQRLDIGRGCYIHCDASALLDPAVVSALGVTPCSSGGVEACSFEGGTDQLRVIADYGDLEFDSCLEVESPALSALLDGEGIVKVPEMVPGCAGGRRYFAHRAFAAPVASSASVRFRVESGDNFFSDTGPFPLKQPAISIEAERCLDAAGEVIQDCTLVAGIDSTLVTVTAPDALLDDTAVIEFTTGFESSGSVTIELEPSGGAMKSGSYRLSMPDEAGSYLSISAKVGGLFATHAPIQLVGPRPLQIEVVKLGETPDFIAPRAPSVAAGEPIEACRTFTAAVLAPDGAPGDRVALQTTSGTLDGVGKGVEKELVWSGSNRLIMATLSLPASPSEMNVGLFAEAGALSGSLSFELAPLLPKAAGLSTSQKVVTVGASGSEPVTIVGFAVPPSPGAKFPPGTTLPVVITAAPSAAPILSCGAPLNETDIDCDPTKEGQLPGGCLLAPKFVSVTPAGEFTISLSPGICFTGIVYVDVYSKMYTSDEQCLGDRTVTEGAVRLTAGPVLAIDYQPQ